MKMGIFSPGAAVGLILFSTPVLAQVAQAYSYDANGRLIGVVTTGSAGTNNATYAYDDATNRTSRSQTGVAAYAAIYRLSIGQPLGERQALTSPNDRHTLALRSSGQVELWTEAALVAERAVGERFQVDERGALRFVVPAGLNTPADAWVALDETGDLIVSQNDGDILWRSTDTPIAEASQ